MGEPVSLSGNAAMLNGVCVIDLTTVVFGPYCTQILSDFGADVIKVEPPIGDIFRYSGRPGKTTGMSPGHMTLNRGKRSAALDLKSKDDRDTVLALVKDADILIHNIRGGAVDRLGLGYQAIKAINPEIIYVHCVGFGAGGPYSDLQAYDDVIQAASGATTLSQRVSDGSPPKYIPSLIADKVAGLSAVYATMAAVIHKLRTGRGQFVEVPLFEAFTHFIMKEHLYGMTFDPPKGKACYSRQVDPDRQPFATADGFISIVPYTPQSLLKLFKLIGAPELCEDERFSTPGAYMRNANAAYAEIAKFTPAKTTADWLAILRDNDIPAMAVRDADDMLDDPHLQAVDFFERKEHPTEGVFFEMREPSRFSDWQKEENRPPPNLGEHTDEIRELAKRVAESKEK